MITAVAAIKEWKRLISIYAYLTNLLLNIKQVEDMIQDKFPVWLLKGIKE